MSKQQDFKNILEGYRLGDLSYEETIRGLDILGVVIKVDSGDSGQNVTSSGYEIAAIEPIIGVE